MRSARHRDYFPGLRLPVLILLLALAVLPPGAAQTATAPVFNPANGHWYQVVRVPGGIVWPQARIAAEALFYAGYHGHLATITSEEENQFLAQHVLPAARSYNGLWLGGYQDPSAPDYREPAGGWRWVTGEPWNFTNWHPGEPNNAGPEHALHVTGNNHTWNDLNGAQAIDGYVVEYSPPPAPTAARIGILPNPVAGARARSGCSRWTVRRRRGMWPSRWLPATRLWRSCRRW